MIEKKVKIEVVGKQDGDEVSLKVEGTYTKKSDSEYLEYLDDEKVKNHLKIEENKILVTKYTDPPTNMVFEPKVPYTLKYTTPYGQMDLTILTSNLDIQKQGTNHDIKINYTMVVAGEKVEKELTIKVADM